MRASLVTVCALLSVAALAAREFAPCLSDFQGVNYLAPAEVMRQLGLGWTREAFKCDWGAIEPAQDEWRFEPYDEVVLAAHERGVDVLTLLAYTASWASSKEGDSRVPARDVNDWSDYVEHMVARYSRPPFNLRYFQVWNEPTWEPLTFWHASGEEWVEKVFIPAAKVIRAYGCEVVFGGWPVADHQHLLTALEYRDAWKWTDIIDVHYFSSDIFQTLYDRYVKQGKCKGIWQTELGFLSFPNYYPNAYLRTLHWCLTHDWDFADKYKLFWFASWGAGPDAPRCLTGPGEDGNNTLTEHGKRARTLHRVLGGGRLAALTDFTVDLDLPPTLNEEAPCVLGFKVGDARRVVAFLLTPEEQKAHPRVKVAMPWEDAERTPHVRLLQATGEELDMEATIEGGKLRMDVPVGELDAAVARNYGREWRVAVGYLVVDEAD